MALLMSRRAALATGSGFALSLVSARADAEGDFNARLAALEKQHGGRVGVAVIDTGNGRHTAYRGNERFALCSTFKLLAAALVLARVDLGEEQLDRRVVFQKSDLVTYSPTTEKHVG